MAQGIKCYVTFNAPGSPIVEIAKIAITLTYRKWNFGFGKNTEMSYFLLNHDSYRGAPKTENEVMILVHANSQINFRKGFCIKRNNWGNQASAKKIQHHIFPKLCMLKG